MTGQGNVFLMGKSDIKGRQGSQSKNPTDIIELELENIKKISSGQNYSLALSKDGRVYAFGNNYFGQLGTGSLKSENEPIILDHFIRDKIVDISCGDNYSGAVT